MRGVSLYSDDKKMLIIICHDEYGREKKTNDKHLKSFVTDISICSYLYDKRTHKSDIKIRQLYFITYSITFTIIPNVGKHPLILLT